MKNSCSNSVSNQVPFRLILGTLKLQPYCPTFYSGPPLIQISFHLSLVGSDTLLELWLRWPPLYQRTVEQLIRDVNDGGYNDVASLNFLSISPVGTKCAC